MNSMPSLSSETKLPAPPAPVFADAVGTVLGGPLTARGVEVLQVNLGYRCNMGCGHCHVSAAPDREESMAGDTVQEVLRVLRENPIPVLDITGGAPELNPSFRMLVTGARSLGKRAVVRTNLTVISEEGNEDLPEFFRDHHVELIASLPCYLEQNVDTSRGSGAYAKSIGALKRLNSLGYGKEGEVALPLGLVYNPGGPFLPPTQSCLEADYKRELLQRFGITFNRLYVFTNMPLGRFRSHLERRGELDGYRRLLASSFNPGAVSRVMCRTMLSVGWDGTLADCDFNQVLGIPVTTGRRTIREYEHAAVSRRVIAVDEHCYGCTAGQGSS